MKDFNERVKDAAGRTWAWTDCIMPNLRVWMLLFVFAACGVDEQPTVDATVYPTCESLGCHDLDLSDKRCAETGECFCAPSRNVEPVRCDP